MYYPRIYFEILSDDIKYLLESLISVSKFEPMILQIQRTWAVQSNTKKILEIFDDFFFYVAAEISFCIKMINNKFIFVGSVVRFTPIRTKLKYGYQSLCRPRERILLESVELRLRISVRTDRFCFPLYVIFVHSV